MRCLDIGPGWGGHRLEGFETLDIEKRDNVDHVADAGEPLPFDDDTFDIVHASHILEHIPWQEADEVLKEWVRILKPGGVLEIWVPNALAACKRFVEAESGNLKRFKKGSSYQKEIVKKDPCRAFSGAILSYRGAYRGDAGIHKSLYSPRYLKVIMGWAGLVNIKKMDWEKENRMRNHSLNSIGMKGTKP